MKIIRDVPFGELYKNHLAVSGHFNLPPERWDKRADEMAQKLVDKDNEYRQAFVRAVAASPDETLLDVGCGPGTLALTLAPVMRHVWALDYAPGMLRVLGELQQKKGITNITPVLKSWNDDWTDVPQADVVIASRSTLVDDVEDMIDKLNAKAKKRVVISATTRAHFFDDAVFKAIGREDDPGFPTYIYIVNALYQRGIMAKVDFIESEGRPLPTADFETLKKSLEFSIGALNDTEVAGLKALWEARTAAGETIRRGQDRWALISWDTAGL